MIVLACAALAGCLICWWPANPSARAATRMKPADRPRLSTRRNRWRHLLLPTLGIAFSGYLAPRLLLWTVPASVVILTVGWLVANGRAERLRRRNSEEVVQACLAVATQLRVGEIPSSALRRVAADSLLLQPVAAAQQIGGDVPAALRIAAAEPGCSGLAALGRSWQLCQVTGAPIADAAFRVAEGLRAEAATERLVAAELASPRATGRLPAFLPLMGIGLGFTAGGDPVAFLVGSLPGRVCLAIAVCLVCAGLVWTTLLGRAPANEGEAE